MPGFFFQLRAFTDWVAAHADEFVFVVLAALAVGSAVSLVVQRNPLYCAISLIFVFMSLAGLYLTLAAPFIAAIQIIVYAGAIMVLVVFVIMLLNVEEEERRPLRLRALVPLAIVGAGLLFAEAAFILYWVNESGADRARAAGAADTGLTASIGAGLFTTYLLPFEITSLLILMAVVGAMTLARRASAIRPTDLVVPGSSVLARHTLTPEPDSDATAVFSRTTAEAESALGLAGVPRRREED